jgi:hypothetical protein
MARGYNASENSTAARSSSDTATISTDATERRALAKEMFGLGTELKKFDLVKALGKDGKELAKMASENKFVARSLDRLEVEVLPVSGIIRMNIGGNESMSFPSKDRESQYVIPYESNEKAFVPPIGEDPNSSKFNKDKNIVFVSQREASKMLDDANAKISKEYEKTPPFEKRDEVYLSKMYEQRNALKKSVDDARSAGREVIKQNGGLFGAKDSVGRIAVPVRKESIPQGHKLTLFEPREIITRGEYRKSVLQNLKMFVLSEAGADEYFAARPNENPGG